MPSLTFSHSCGTRRPQLLLAAVAEHPDATRDLENDSLVAPSCSAFSFRFVFWSVPMLECSQSVCVCVCLAKAVEILHNWIPRQVSGLIKTLIVCWSTKSNTWCFESIFS